MSEISAAAVKQLRDRTDLPMMDCKKALIEADGDMDKAIDILRSKFKKAVAKRADRETAEGRVVGHADHAKKLGGLVEIRCESAPVAKADAFLKLCDAVAKQVALGQAQTVDQLMQEKLVGDPKKTVEDLLTETIGLLQENMKIARFVRFQGVAGHYTHHDGTVGAMVAVEGNADPALLRDICMHITATNPVAGTLEELPKDFVEKEKQIAIAQTKEDPKMAGKPDEIIEKSVQGKLNKTLAQNLLLEQPFVKDESKKVGDLLKSAGAKYKGFARYRVGESS